HAPTGRMWPQRFNDERSAIVFAADLNDPAVRPLLAQLVEVVEKKRSGEIRLYVNRLTEALNQREPLRLVEYRRRYGQDPPADALAPVSEREPQAQLSERAPPPAEPVPATPAAPRFAGLAELLEGEGRVPPARSTVSASVPRPSTRPTVGEAWSYLGS